MSFHHIPENKILAKISEFTVYAMQLYPVFNLGYFKGGHLHLISDENKPLSNIFPIHIMLKMGKGSFDVKGGQCPHGPF